MTTYSHKLLGCLILLQQCILVVTLFLVRRWGVRADALLKAWTALLLSPFATSLFPVCHQLPSCLHYFSVMSVGLWWVSVSFLEMTVSIGRPCDNDSAPQKCWAMRSGTCLLSALQQSYFAGLTLGFVHSANMFCLWFRHLTCAQVWFIVKNWALGYIYRPKRLKFACRSVQMKYCTLHLTPVYTSALILRVSVLNWCICILVYDSFSHVKFALGSYTPTRPVWPDSQNQLIYCWKSN